MNKCRVVQSLFLLLIVPFTVIGQQVDTVNQTVSDGNNGAKAPASLEVGVVIGEPSGLSAKYWVSKGSAFDLGVGWSFADEGRFDIYGDYLYHPYYIPSQYGDLPIFVGVGAALRISDNSFFGVRFPFGVEMLWDRIPLALFAQLAPIMEIIPDIDFRLEGGFGVRYAFGRPGS